MKISFDFDNTLTNTAFYNHVKKTMKAEFEYFIITKRFTRNKQNVLVDNLTVFLMAKDLGIKKENVFFTNGAFKYETCKKLKINIHYDDNKLEIGLLNNSPSCGGILVDEKYILSLCNQL